MATKTYSEVAVRAMLKAARELRLVACNVLDDMQNEVELTSDASHQWARQTARKYAEMANDLEAKTYSVGPVGDRAWAAQVRNRDQYSQAITAYQNRRKAATETASERIGFRLRVEQARL